MMKTPLKTYYREIESQIEQGEYDQAIAHCLHILHYFPKSINTYRLLGKAYLENQRYGDASDVFQRVLSSVPDDYISLVGMSIIREDEGNLEDALWHMERAFEIKPANSAIQGELRRLYGRRDGFEPPKINLTRGALARMYIKGGLFQQAITELRIALSENPIRPDLLIQLARAYNLAGQKAEAVDVCNNVLLKLPYCLEANQIMTEILTGTDRSAELQTYQSRYLSLNPYAAHLSSNAPTPEQVPDAAVTVEKFDWKPGVPISDLPPQPKWATAIGIEIKDTLTENEELPEWLRPQSDELSDVPQKTETPVESRFPGEITPQEEIQSNEPMEGFVKESMESEIEQQGPSPIEPSVSSDLMPEWIKEIGQQSLVEKDAELESPAPFKADSTIKGEIEQAEIPDWLKSLAPEQPSAKIEDEIASVPISGKEEMLPWLEETIPAPTDSIDTWLKDFEVNAKIQEPILEQQAPITTEETPLSEAELEKFELPDWIGEIKEQPPRETEIPDWILESDMGTQKPSKPSEEIAETEEKTSPPTNIIDTQPLKISAAEEPISGDTQAEQIIDWLRSAEDDNFSEEVVTDVPDEMQMFDSESRLETIISEPEVKSTEELPINLDDSSAAIAWLESLAAKQTVEETLITKSEDRTEEPPDWVKRFSSESEEENPSDIESIFPEESIAIPFETPTLETQPSDSGIPEWLKDYRVEMPQQPSPLSEPVQLVLPKDMLPVTQPVDEYEEKYLRAHEYLNQGLLPDAISEFTSLLKSNKYISEIIDDLNQATYRYPMDVSVWQILGDAYLRADKLQAALDAYTKAEGLLR